MPRKSAAIDPSEADLHRAVAEYLDWMLLPPAVYSTFPAGWGKLGKAMAGQLKASGLKPGMPDIFVFDRHTMIANRTYTKVVGLELKAPGQKPSAAQQLMFSRLRGLGVMIYVCECLEDVIAALKEQQIGLRSSWQGAQQEHRSEQPGATSAERGDLGDGDGAAQRKVG
jgi:hypothetical protein